MFKSALLVVPALLSLVAADPFQGLGKINVVNSGATAGCLTTSGQFTVDTSACAEFTGYLNVTHYQMGSYTNYWYLNTTDGYCGAPPTKNYTIECAPNVNKETDSYWEVSSA